VAPWAREGAGGFTTPDPSPKTPKSIKWENRSKLGIPDPLGGKKKSSFGGQLKSPFSGGKNISKKNQFALFAFQRTLYLLAAFCGTIFLKLCNQKTRFILGLI